MVLINVFFLQKYYSQTVRVLTDQVHVFHVLTVRGLSGSEGPFTPCMGLPGNA